MWPCLLDAEALQDDDEEEIVEIDDEGNVVEFSASSSAAPAQVLSPHLAPLPSPDPVPLPAPSPDPCGQDRSHCCSYCTVQYSTVQVVFLQYSSTVQYSTVLHDAENYSTVLDVQYSTVNGTQQCTTTCTGSEDCTKDIQYSSTVRFSTPQYSTESTPIVQYLASNFEKL